jgi:CrcB protein
VGRFLLIGAGGVIGAVLRYTIGTQIQLWFKSSHFPYGTLLVNLSGCFLIGFVFFYLAGRGWLDPAGFLLITGILGAYTTFSTFSLDMFSLASSGDWSRAAAYFLLTNGLGVLLLAAGKLIADLALRG